MERGRQEMARTAQSEMDKLARQKGGTGGSNSMKQKGRGASGRGGPHVQRAAEAARVAGLDVSKARMSAPAGGSGGVVKKARYKPGALALKEIRKYQKSTDPILRMAPFMRLVRSRGDFLRSSPGRLPGKIMRFKMAAVETMREITEYRMVRILEDAQLLALHRRVKGVQTKDLRLAARIRDQPARWMWEDLERKRGVEAAESLLAELDAGGR